MYKGNHLDAGRKLNVHQYMEHIRLVKVLRTFNLRFLYRGRYFLNLYSESCFGLWHSYERQFLAKLRNLTVCYYHVTCEFQSESTLFSCLNIKELLAGSRRHIWSLSESNGIRTHKLLVCKRTLNHLAKLTRLAKRLSVRLRSLFENFLSFPLLFLLLCKLVSMRHGYCFMKTNGPIVLHTKSVIHRNSWKYVAVAMILTLLNPFFKCLNKYYLNIRAIFLKYETSLSCYYCFDLLITTFGTAYFFPKKKHLGFSNHLFKRSGIFPLYLITSSL